MSPSGATSFRTGSGLIPTTGSIPVKCDGAILIHKRWLEPDRQCDGAVSIH